MHDSRVDFIASPTPIPEQGSCLALGFFDGVHLGHQQILKHALAEAAELGVAPLVYTFTNHPATVLRPRHVPHLLTTFEERLRILHALGMECFYEPFTPQLAELSPLEFCEEVLVRRLKARSISVGANYRFGRRAQGTPAFMQSWGRDRGIDVRVCELAKSALGAELCCANGAERISSSRLRRLVQAGEMQAVTRLMGRPYEIGNNVVHGKQLGRKWGFPTANLPMVAEKVAPAFGAYACQVVLPHGEERPAVGYFGTRPTVDGLGSRACIEINIAQSSAAGVTWDSRCFSEDHEGEFNLYGQHIRVRFLKYLAPQERFGGLADLQKRLEDYRRLTAELFTSG